MQCGRQCTLGVFASVPGMMMHFLMYYCSGFLTVQSACTRMDDMASQSACPENAAYMLHMHDGIFATKTK
jgi:hypothetical protein